MGAFDWLVGNGESGEEGSPGLLGTGKYKVDKYNIDKSAYEHKDAAAANQSKINALGQKYGNMSAPQVSQDQLAQAKAAQGKGAQAQAGNIGPAAQVGFSNAGQAQQMQAGQVGPTAQINRQDEFGRNAQAGLIGQLQTQAAGGGPSLAGEQLKQARENDLANQMAAASAGGGRNAALGQRQLAAQAASSAQTTANAAAQARMQEQLNAQQQLAGVSSQMRGADINVNQAQAAMQNENQLAQAGFNQGANQFNAGQGNQMAQFQAQLNQQANLANQGAKNQYGLENFNAQNQFGMANLQNNQQMALANLQNQQQGNMYNAQAWNQQLGQNQQAQLGQNQQNLQGAMGFQQMGLGAQQQEYQNQMDYQNAMAQQNAAYNAMQAQAFQNQAQAEGGLTQGLIGGVAGAMMSDKREKDSIQRGEGSLHGMLTMMSDKYQKDISDNDLLNNYLKSAQSQGGSGNVGAGWKNLGGQMGGMYSAKQQQAAQGSPSVQKAGNQFGQSNGNFGQFGMSEAGAQYNPNAVGPMDTSSPIEVKDQFGDPNQSGSMQGLLKNPPKPQTAMQAQAATAYAQPSPAQQDKAPQQLQSQGRPSALKPLSMQGGAGQSPAQQGTQQRPPWPESQQNASRPPWPEKSQTLSAGINAGGNASLQGAGQPFQGNYKVQPSQQSLSPQGRGAQQGLELNPGIIQPQGSQGGPQGEPRLNQNVNVQVPTSPQFNPNSFAAGQPQLNNNLGDSMNNVGGLSFPVQPQQSISNASLPSQSFNPYINPNLVSSPIEAKQDFGAGNGSIQNFLNQKPQGQGMGWGQMGGISMNGGQNQGLRDQNQQIGNYMQMYQPQMGKTGIEVGQGAQNATNMNMGAYAKGSDKRGKENISDDQIEGKIEGMLAKLKAYDYNYKDPSKPGAAPGRHTSVMAQDLEASPLGATAVKETPNGKMVDYGRLSAINLAGLAMENERLNKLEGLLAERIQSERGKRG